MHDRRETMTLLRSPELACPIMDKSNTTAHKSHSLEESLWSKSMSQKTPDWQNPEELDCKSYSSSKVDEIFIIESDSPTPKCLSDKKNSSGVSGASTDTCCPKESETCVSSPTQTEAPNIVSTAAEASSPNSSNLKYSGGARPKTHLPSKSSKKGTASKKTLATSARINMTDYDQKRTLLSSVKISEEFLNSPAVQAVKSMVSDKISEQVQYLIEMATKMLRVKLNRYPTSEELLEIIDVEGWGEKQIVSAFIAAIQSEQGRSIVESLLQDNVPPEKQKDDRNTQPEPLEYHEGTHTHCKHDEHLLGRQNFSTEVKVSERLPEKQQDPREMRHMALKLEQMFLKESLTCVLCKERQIEVTLLPCGHFVLCGQCSKDCYVCPVCNKQALGEVKTFLC